MPYMVQVRVRVNRVARGMGGSGLQQNNADIGGYGSGDTPGNAPSGQSMYFQVDEVVPGTLDSPTAANIGTALTTAATDIQAKITAPVLAQIQGWATGGE